MGHDRLREGGREQIQVRWLVLQYGLSRWDRAFVASQGIYGLTLQFFALFFRGTRYDIVVLVGAGPRCVSFLILAVEKSRAPLLLQACRVHGSDLRCL